MARRKRKVRPPVRERHYKHIVARYVEAGEPIEVAERIAAAVVNKYRRRLAEEGRGPKLVTEGGSRRQWYPGKVVKRTVRKGRY